MTLMLIKNAQIKEKSLNLNKDVAFSDYGYSFKPSLGSYFFTSRAKEFFQTLKEAIYTLREEDERALRYLIEKKDPGVDKKYNKLNITYNFGMRKVEENYERADKPLKVLHFHLWVKDLPTVSIFMYGNNGLEIPLMSNRLKNLFNKHGVK